MLYGVKKGSDKIACCIGLSVQPSVTWFVSEILGDKLIPNFTLSLNLVSKFTFAVYLLKPEPIIRPSWLKYPPETYQFVLPDLPETETS